MAENLSQKMCTLENAVLYCNPVSSHLFSLHLTIQIVLEEKLLQTQLLELILKQKQGKVF